MHRLRSTYGKRWLVGLMLASLMPVLFASVGTLSQEGSSYAGWVRGQLRAPADAAIEQALDVATQSHAVSLDAFFDAFVEAYEAQEVNRPLGHFFGSLDLSGEALIVYLQSRFSSLVGDALLPRTALIATPVATSPPSTRPDVLSGVSAQHSAARVVACVVTEAMSAGTYVVPLRTLFAAQPLGP